MSKKWYPVIKIAVPLLIVVGIATIWIFKNLDKSKEQEINLASTNSDFDLNITEEIDLEQLKSYGVPIIIDFGADSCIPCKEMAPVLEKLNEELKGKAIVRFVDVWKYPELAKDYPISIIPTQMFFDKDGKPYVPSDENSNGMIMYSTKDTKEHIFTAHEGGITEDTLLEILSEMGMEE